MFILVIWHDSDQGENLVNKTFYANEINRERMLKAISIDAE